MRGNIYFLSSISFTIVTWASTKLAGGKSGIHRICHFVNLIIGNLLYCVCPLVCIHAGYTFALFLLLKVYSFTSFPDFLMINLPILFLSSPWQQNQTINHCLWISVDLYLCNFLIWIKWIINILLKDLAHWENFPSSLFQNTPSWACTAAKVHLLLVPAYHVESSINQTWVFFLLSQILIRNIPWGHRCCQRMMGALFNMWNKKTKLNWWLTIIRESFASQTQSLCIELGYFNKIVVDWLVLTGEFIGANLFLIGWIPEARGFPWLAVCHHGYRTISLF